MQSSHKQAALKNKKEQQSTAGKDARYMRYEQRMLIAAGSSFIAAKALSVYAILCHITWWFDNAVCNQRNREPIDREQEEVWTEIERIKGRPGHPRKYICIKKYKVAPAVSTSLMLVTMGKEAKSKDGHVLRSFEIFNVGLARESPGWCTLEAGAFWRCCFSKDLRTVYDIDPAHSAREVSSATWSESGVVHVDTSGTQCAP